MGLNRRTFLQKAGLGLAMLGVSETVLSLLGDSRLAVPVLDSYSQALAQPGGRKLALLVGINQYPRTTALSGCVTDVELQRELLIHRFGFKSSDILTLTDSQASRQNIETAFVEHLTEQAQAGDFVVFHFSGYGSSVKMSQEPSTDEAFRLQNSLVPVDGILPTKEAAVANDLLEETLVLLLRSLATDHVITVLDTSHIGTSSVLRGNLRVRSCPNPPAQAPSPDELVFQEQIRLRTNSIGEKLLNIASPNRIPGVVLAAAGSTEVATEAQWNGFSAGLFTYALTQYLWQASPATTIQISVSRAAGMVNQLVGKQQQPSVWHQNSQQSSLLAYYLPPIASIGADGVVTALEENGRTAQLWLAGLPPKVLEYYGSNSILSLYPAQPNAEELKVSELLAQRGVAQVESSENNLQPSTLQPSTLQPSTLQPSTLQPSTLRPSTLQPSTLQPSTLQPSNLQPSNLQPSTVQPSTVQPSAVQSPSLEKLQLQIRSKEGLTAKARIVGISVTDNSPLKVG